MDVQAGAVPAIVISTDLSQPYHPASASYAGQHGSAPLLRFMAATPGVYPPRVAQHAGGGALARNRFPPTMLLDSDTATVAEYSPAGVLLSVR